MIHNHFKTLYDPQADDPFAMEIEFKITSEDILAIKQARPWVFAEVNEPPAVTGTSTFSYRENGTAAVYTFRATDPEGSAITWSLSGADDDDFTIDETGVLAFANPPNYESPADSGRDNVYEVTVVARDDAFNSGMLGVVVTVTRADPASTDDATLGALTLAEEDGSSISLTPSFAAATTDYAASVAYDVGSVTMTATKNHGGASVAVIQEDGTVTSESATVGLAVGETLIKAMVTAEDGQTVLIYRVTVTRAPAWSATLTVGVEDDTHVPPAAGFSRWSRLGSLSSRSFVLDDRSYRVLTVVHLAGGLFLHLDGELPSDFTLAIGDQEFVASESSIPRTPTAGRYWWETDIIGWNAGDTVDVSLIPTGWLG